MRIIEYKCPSCGATARKKLFSNKYKCDYCYNVFSIEETSNIFANVNKQQNKKTSSSAFPLSTAIFSAFLLIGICSFVLTFYINDKSSSNNISQNNNYQNISEQDLSEDYWVDELEHTDKPVSAMGIDIMEKIFGKKIEDITVEDISTIKYFKMYSEISEDDIGFDTFVDYSFDDYKDYDNIDDFNNTVQTVKPVPDYDFEYNDFGCMTGLTKLDVSSCNKESLSYMKDLTSLKCGYYLPSQIEKYVDTEKLEEIYIGDACESDFEDLAKFSNLKKVCIEDISCTSIPSQLLELDNLESLTIKDGDNLKDFSNLYKMVNLKELVLDYVDNFKDLSVINNMNKLESLTLISTNVLNYESLTNNDHIKKLVLQFNDNVNDITPVSTLKNLEEFDTIVYTIAGMDSLAKLQNIKKLTLSTNGSTSIDFVGQLSDLNNLTLICCYTENNFEFIHSLKNLKKLRIEGHASDVDYNDLLNVKGLEDLYISASEYDSIWLGNLLESSSLKKFELTGGEVHMKLGMDLSNSNIETLKLNNIEFYGETGWDETSFDTVVSMIGTMKNLKNLQIRKDKIENIEALSSLNSLEKLDISGNFISNLEPIKDLDNLKELDIRDNITSNIDGLDGVTVFN